MCRSAVEGGRRCPACGSYTSAARANKNRALNRKARRRVVEHLRAQGMQATAAAVLDAPPSMIPEVVAELGIDDDVLDGIRMPSTHASPPSAGHIIELAGKEQAGELAAAAADGPQAQLEAAKAALEQAQAHADESKKAVGRAYYQVTKARKTGDEQAEQDARAAHAQAKDTHKQALGAIADAESDVLLAEYACRDDLDEVARDEYLAGLSAEDRQAIEEAATRQYTEQARQVLVTDNQLAIADAPFDTSIYETATLHATIDGQTVDAEGRRMDAGTAIMRRGYGQFVVLYDTHGDGNYQELATAGSKQQAIDKASRVPHITGRGVAGAPDDPLGKTLAESNDAAITGIAAAAADGTLAPGQAKQQLASRLDTAAAEAADALGGAHVRAEISAATGRHNTRLRHAAADKAGDQARQEALAAGATKADADKAYRQARRRALGTPTRGGGVIPTFDHKIPPESLGQAGYASLARSGIRPTGTQSAADYQVIAARAGAGAPKQWGFTTSSGGADVGTSSIASVTKQFTPVMKTLSSKEKNALTTYTGGGYTTINAAITGRDSNPSPTTAATVNSLHSAFSTAAQHNTNTTAMTVLRGTKVPSGWKGTTDEYLEQAFTVGSRMQIGKVTSCTTKPSTANSFGGHPPYVMAIRTRDGVPVKSISQHKGEDEVIVPPGTNLRCVHVDKHGFGGKPTVYLVAEDLVAEADETAHG